MLLTRERTAKSQLGAQTDLYGGSYTQGAGDINFAPGQMILLRFPTTLPRKAGINSATIKFNVVVKNADQTQNSSHRIWAHASGDSPMLVTGVNNWANRAYTNNVVNWTATWTANEQQTTPDNLVYRTVDITSLISELVWRDDWVPGGYITLMILCDSENGSDMGIRANNDFLPTPRINIDYVEPLVDERVTVNMCENSEFGLAVQSIGTDSNPTPYWSQNEAYGAYVPAANQATLARDTVFTRVPGVPTMKVTCGPPHSEVNRRTGPVYGINDNVNQSTIFCGWIYVPSYIPADADPYAGDIYQGGGQLISQRDQWVPFCSNPIARPEDWATWWFAVSIRRFQQGWQFWISEPSILRSTFKQMPFNGLTPDREPGINHISTATGMASARVWTPKRTLMLDGVFPRAYPSWIKRSDGILQLAEPVKGGPTMANMPSSQIQNYDSSKRIAEY